MSERGESMGWRSRWSNTPILQMLMSNQYMKRCRQAVYESTKMQIDYCTNKFDRIKVTKVGRENSWEVSTSNQCTHTGQHFLLIYFRHNCWAASFGSNSAEVMEDEAPVMQTNAPETQLQTWESHRATWKYQKHNPFGRDLWDFEDMWLQLLCKLV